METAIILGALIAIPAAAIWLSKRSVGESAAEHRQLYMTGAETDAPRALYVEPLNGPLVNGAEVEELSHRSNPPKAGDQ